MIILEILQTKIALFDTGNNAHSRECSKKDKYFCLSGLTFLRPAFFTLPKDSSFPNASFRDLPNIYSALDVEVETEVEVVGIFRLNANTTRQDCIATVKKKNFKERDNMIFHWKLDYEHKSRMTKNNDNCGV
uniref:Uncharacterized protein n=1 Tax=Corethron hystrix TaxID=216773 RepID=A0A7S1G060_9STRA|mmetsp:Transcript_40791/g.95688  ORF Transcript_40791/g.95688 Transcript_40791/m.95688 type:complete len:132 (+) Transcript_40791:889-1284(+)